MDREQSDQPTRLAHNEQRTYNLEKLRTHMMNVLPNINTRINGRTAPIFEEMQELTRLWMDMKQTGVWSQTPTPINHGSHHYHRDGLTSSHYPCVWEPWFPQEKPHL